MRKTLTILKVLGALLFAFLFLGGYSAIHDALVDYRYFDTKDSLYASLAVLLIFVVMMLLVVGGLIVISKRAALSKYSTTAPTPQQEKVSKYAYLVNNIIYILIMLAALFGWYSYSRQSGDSKYDVIYAYGTTEALNQVQVQDGKIISQDGNIVFYYYSFKHEMGRVDHDESSPSNSKYVAYEHEITENNLEKFKIINTTNVSPDNIQIKKTFEDFVFVNPINLADKPGLACNLRTDKHKLFAYEGGLEYDDCKVIGWIKAIY